MKKKIVVLGLVALLAVVASITAAWAINQSIRGNAIDVVPAQTDPTGPGTLWIRYYRQGFATANPAAGTCPTGLLDLGGNQRFCEGAYKSFKGGYQGHVENAFNFGDAPSGTRFYGTYGLELNTGTASHQGFYAWNSNVVTGPGSTMQWFQPDCSGTNDPHDCVGHALASDAVGTDQTGIPGPDIAPIGSLRPIPVPKVSSVSPNTAPATINLSWSAATESGGSGDAASYILWYAVDDANDGNCALPTDADLTNQLNTVPIAGTTTAVDVAADLGLTVGAENCVTFALQIEYANLGANAATAVRSRYLSANGQPVYLGAGGLAADIVNLRAEALGVSRGGLRVQVSWDTSLEDGVQGFYVARSNTADGEFARVSDLIPANGTASSYDYLDVVHQGRDLRNATGLFYRIETLDIDDSVSLAGPVTVSLPESGALPGSRPMRRR